jgi:hypothetical protein
MRAAHDGREALGTRYFESGGDNCHIGTRQVAESGMELDNVQQLAAIGLAGEGHQA